MQAKEGKGFKRAFQTLQNLGRIGGLVVAQYDPRHFYVGQVNPCTEIELYDLGRVKGQQDNCYKLLKLARRMGAYSYADYLLLAALRPPYVAICHCANHSPFHGARNIPRQHNKTGLEVCFY